MLAHYEIVAVLLAFLAASAIAAPTMRIPADEIMKRDEAIRGEFGDEPFVRVDARSPPDESTSKHLTKRVCKTGAGGSGSGSRPSSPPPPERKKTGSGPGPGSGPGAGPGPGAGRGAGATRGGTGTTRGGGATRGRRR